MMLNITKPNVFYQYLYNREMQGWKAGPNNKGYSLRTKKLGNMSLFTKEIVYSFLISNVLTFIIGAGIG